MMDQTMGKDALLAVQELMLSGYAPQQPLEPARVFPNVEMASWSELKHVTMEAQQEVTDARLLVLLSLAGHAQDPRLVVILFLLMRYALDQRLAVPEQLDATLQTQDQLLGTLVLVRILQHVSQDVETI